MIELCKQHLKVLFLIFFDILGNHRYPFDCSTSKYGCCSDNLTPRTDPWGEKCPKCEDKAPELCEPHINDCNEIGMVGNWMRANCMKTCGGCIPKAESAGMYQLYITFYTFDSLVPS